MTAVLPTKVPADLITDTAIMRTLAAAAARQLAIAVPNLLAEVLYEAGWLAPDGLHWKPTPAGEAWMASKRCTVCDGPSVTVECTRCVIDDETAWKRENDR